MTRGPKPKPVALKVLAGNPGKRRLPKELKLPRATGVCPDDMPKTGREMWNKFFPMLTSAGVLKESDMPAFEDLCLAWAHFKDADEKCKKKGLTQKTKDGYETVSVWVHLRTKFQKEFKILVEQFGMTPTSRARIEADMPAMVSTQQGDEAAEFFGEPVVGTIGHAG